VPAYTPPLNETTSPYLFDSAVSIGGAAAWTSLSPWAPADFGFKAWNIPTYFATGTSTFNVVGSVYLTTMHLTANQTYSNIYVSVLASGGTATAGSCFAGIYNSAGTLVATTADISGVLGTGAANLGNLAFPLSTSYTPSAGGLFYVGMFFNTSGTASFPVLRSMVGQTAANGLTAWAGTVGWAGLNGTGAVGTGTNVAPYPWSAIATTSATSMPASFTLGSAGTTGATCFWCGLA
jgi:hypothetical protein